MYRTSMVKRIVLFGILSFSFIAAVNAGTQNISTRNDFPASLASVAVPSTVKCTSAYGDVPSGGVPPKCWIESPGYSGLVAPGTSVGTSGAGTVKLTCVGSVTPNGVIFCAAEITDSVCITSRVIPASSSGGSSVIPTVPLSKVATLSCNSAIGGTYGTKCSVQSPGFNGFLTPGQSAGTTGAGTVMFGCQGSYPINGGLSCTLGITQSCP